MTSPNETDFSQPDVSDLKVIVFRLNILEEGQRKLEAGQNAILDELRKREHCQSPGLCLVLQKELKDRKKTEEDLNSRVKAIEDDTLLNRGRVQGVSFTAKALWAIVGFLFSSGLFGILYTLWQSNPKK